LKLQALAPADYLAGDEVIDLSHPSIKGLASSLRAEHGDDTSFARAAFEYASACADSGRALGGPGRVFDG